MNVKMIGQCAFAVKSENQLSATWESVCYAVKNLAGHTYFTEASDMQHTARLINGGRPLEVVACVKSTIGQEVRKTSLD